MLNRNIQKSLQEQLAEILEGQIRTGEFQEEAKLPSLRSLAHEYSVSHETVSASMAILKTRKLVRIIPNRGVYVESIHNSSPGTGFIGFVLDLGARRPLPTELEPLYGELFGLISQELNQHNYHLVGNYICFEEPKDRKILRSLTENKIDGLIICNLFYSKLHKYVIDNFSPVVALLPSEQFDDFDQIGLNYYHTYFNIAKFFLGRGLTKIKFFSGPNPYFNSQQMIRGVMDAMVNVLDCEIKFTDIGLTSYGWNHDDAEKFISEWLETDDKAELLICANDNLAVGAINAIQKKGLIVGQHIQVVGGRNTALSTMVRPELSSIDYHYDELVRMAVQQLLKRIDGDTGSALELNLNGQLVQRGSTK